MKEERQQSIVSSLPILAMVAIIAGAYYVSRLPLESSRPESPLGLEHVVPDTNEIDARLWQDPLKVALDHERAMHRGDVPEDGDPRCVCRSNHSVNQVGERIHSLRKIFQVRILLIIVRDGNFAEDHERRVRNRYAVLAAMHASAFVPEDSKRIRYFKLLWTEENILNEWKLKKEVTPVAPVTDPNERTIIVPFEWFKRSESAPESPACTAVVWLPESAFSHRPLTRLAQVVNAIRGTYNCSATIDVVGPSYSDTVLAMLKEAKEAVELNGEDDQGNETVFSYVFSTLCGLKVFSPWSTASPALLVREAFPEDPNYGSFSEMCGDLTDRLWPSGIEFLRTIGSDDLLAQELVGELHRRGVRDPNEVALISESDTFYGRTFPQLFASMMESIDRKTLKLDCKTWKTYTSGLKPETQGDDSQRHALRTYSYVRGVDGKFLHLAPSEKKESNAKTESQSRWAYNKSLELPIGRSQLDYIRRLAQEMEEDFFRCPPKAIGLVGSDVYDKLILLHAMREQFGDVILFMTDLDARLMHHEQWKWTRNVVVASNFGLKLNKKYRSVTSSDVPCLLPTFRDNYQTSLFFACQTAMGFTPPGSDTAFRNMSQEDLTKYLGDPRLFEIGRGRAVDISVTNAPIHPRVRLPLLLFLGTVLERLFQIAAALALGVLLFAQLNSKIKEEERKGYGWRIIIGVSISVVVVFVAIVIIDHYRLEGEPFSLVAGVSVWPGAALRLIATVMSVCFLARSMDNLRRGSDELHSDFDVEKLDPKARVTFRSWWRSRNEWNHSKNRLIRWLSYLRLLISWPSYLCRISIQGWKPGEGEVNAQELWKDYLVRADFTNRFHRVAALSLAYIGLACALVWIFGLPRTPYRGTTSMAANYVLLFLSGVSMILLIFFVVDATKLSLKLVHSLKTPTTVWPDELLDRFRKSKSRWNNGRTTRLSPGLVLDPMGDEALAEWLDIRFIASHTETVGKLIYYPFIILLLMFVARNRYFDNWDFPISLIIIFLLNSTMALCCGCMLRREAEKTRSVALDRLQKILVEATGAGDECLAGQVQVMIEEVRSIRQGAYSPFTANPVLHAILIPSSGLSLLTLLRFAFMS